MFILMGVIAYYTGVGADVDNLANKLVGHVRGGLLVATQLACGLFGATRQQVITSFNHLQAVPAQHPMKYIFMVSPEIAEDLYELGFEDQQGLSKYIYEATCIPYEELTEDERVRVQHRIDGTINETVHIADRIPPDRLQVFIEGLRPGGKIPILFSPDSLHFVVGGGVEGKALTGWSYMHHVYSWSSNETAKINW